VEVGGVPVVEVSVDRVHVGLDGHTGDGTELGRERLDSVVSLCDGGLVQVNVRPRKVVGSPLRQ
jgi:hypothetical protein